MAAQPGSSMEKPSDDTLEAQIEKQRRLMEMLKQAQQARIIQPQHQPIQPPPNNNLPPPFVKQNGPLPFRDSPVNEPSFAGIPIGRGPPQSAFPMAPGPPQKIWLLEKEMIQKAQAVKVGSPQRVETAPPSRPPVYIQPMGAGLPIDQAILSSSPQSSSQANRVWQHLFPNARIGAQTGPGGPEPVPSQREPVKPVDLGNMGLRQLLGRVVDVTELEGVIGFNQPSVRPPPGFENYKTPPSAPETQSWLIKKGGGGALPPLSMAGSPQQGVSLLSKWKSPLLDQSGGPKTPPLPAELAGGGYGGAMMPGASSPVVGAHRPQPGGGFSLFNQKLPKGSSTKDSFQGFWDNFSDPFNRNKARKGSGSSYQESSVIEASQRLELLDLGDFRYSDDINYSDDTLGPDQGDAEKKKRRRRRSKKRAKKSSECAENIETPPQVNERSASLVDGSNLPILNGEKAPERKRLRRKSRGKKSKVDPGAFDDYLDIDSVMAGLKDSTLIKGEIRINVKNYKECYINDPDDKKDILISGTLDRNRALEGDVVVVQAKDEELPQNPTAAGSQKSGKVVYILEKVHSRVCVGYLTKIGEKDYATLCPRDSRVPRLLIPLTTLSVHIIQNPSAYENILFKAKIVSWESPNFAQGIIVEELGKKGNVNVETVAILKELDLDGDPVPDELSRYLPNSYSVTQEEIAKRLDLRKECIFTIDPETARDLDDAVSIKKVGEDLYEVGVHISDVSMFLTLGTPLDVKVSERATTVYLVDKAIHMLPLELCLQCSLLPGQDKYAVSVIWQMDSEGNIKDTKFSRTVIHSCTKLSYEHAQAIIEGRDVDLPTLYNNVTPEMIRESVLELYKMSKHMTKRRFDGGALRIDQPKVAFRVNEKVVPTTASLYELKDSNRLIEEFMLRANQSAAEYIHSVHPTIALLRRHAPPKGEMMNKLQQSLSTIGIDINISSAGEIHNCIVANSTNDRARGIVLSSLCAKPMTRAEYFCNEPESHHYALNIDMYTHFTSPIRRYCDIVVHRTLCAILGYTDLPSWDAYDVKQFCRTSNKKKNAAKRAGEMSCELFTALYVREQGGMQVEGIVQNVISHALDIIIVPLALATRVYLDRLPAKLDFIENSFNSSLTITWNHVPSLPQTYRLFSTVPVTLKTQETHLSIDTQLLPPSPLPPKPQPPQQPAN